MILDDENNLIEKSSDNWVVFKTILYNLYYGENDKKLYENYLNNFLDRNFGDRNYDYDYYYGNGSGYIHISKKNRVLSSIAFESYDTLLKIDIIFFTNNFDNKDELNLFIDKLNINKKNIKYINYSQYYRYIEKIRL